MTTLTPSTKVPLPEAARASTGAAVHPAHRKHVAHHVRFWDRGAVRYAAAPIADPAGYETTLRRVQALLWPEARVLEIGCGTGSTALRLASGVRRLQASDVSPAMIAIARDKLVATPRPQLSFEVADAHAPLGVDGSVDVVLAFNLLHLVADLDLALARAVQVLRPGGLLISKTPCIAEMNGFIRGLALPLMRAVGWAPPVLILDADALRSAMRRQGLEIASVERHGSRPRDFRVFVVARKPA